MIRTWWPLASLVLVSIAVGQESGGRGVDLSPAAWPAGELQRYAELALSRGQLRPQVEGREGAIAGMTAPRAVRAGLEALKHGGSAADAALTHALTQIVLWAGCCVSHAGMMTMVYFEAATGRAYSLNAAWNTVRGEDDPLSIPAQGVPSGRTALVPGFMAGVQAAHDRFGTLPFASLFGPAIYFAEQGFEVDPALARRIESRREVLGRLPATKAVFTRPDGEWYQAGDLFRQPALARTLRAVAAQGAEFMYRGEWARRLVQAVRAEGGKMTIEDLASYRVIWGEPTRTTYREYQIQAMALPNVGGVNIVEAMNLAELAGLSSLGHYTISSEALFHLIRIARVADVMGTSLANRGTPRVLLRRYLGETDLSPPARLTKLHARMLWDRMQRPEWTRINDAAFEGGGDADSGGSGHSDAVVAVDAVGNVAAVLHSINTALWGTTGIVVDGVSIADAAAFQQEVVARVGPGQRVPEATNPLIVFKEGRPVLASSSINRGVHETTFQSILNILEYGFAPQRAANGRQFLRPSAGEPASEPHGQAVLAGAFPDSVLAGVRARGQSLYVAPPQEYGFWRGDWVGIWIDPTTGGRTAAVSRNPGGIALSTAPR